METVLVLAITAFAVAYIMRKIYRGLQKDGDDICSNCTRCALCAEAVDDKKKDY